MTITISEFKNEIAKVAPMMALLPMTAHEADSPTLGVDKRGTVYVNPSFLSQIGAEHFARLIGYEIDTASALAHVL